MIGQVVRKTSNRMSLNVPVRLTYQGRSVTVRGILDTGTHRTIVSLAVLKRLGIDVGSMVAASVVRGARGTHAAYRITLDRMQVGQCAVSPMVVTAIAELRGEILVGMDFMRAVGAKIDFDRRRASYDCIKETATQAHDARRIVLPFIFRHGKKVARKMSLVDTGATGIIIPETLAHDLGLKVVKGVSRMVAIGVSLSIRRAQIDAIELEGTPCKFGPFSVSIIKEIPFPVIGNSFMLRARAAIDLMKAVNQFEVTCR
jgi:predicted aspartyl protease